MRYSIIIHEADKGYKTVAGAGILSLAQATARNVRDKWELPVGVLDNTNGYFVHPYGEREAK